MRNRKNAIVTRKPLTAGAMAKAAAVALVLCGCARTPTPTVHEAAASAGPYADGRQHRERVRYNGRDYDVVIRHEGAGIFQLVVSAPGRRLGETAGDGHIVEAIALSTLRHFACRSGARAVTIPASLKPEAGRWHMQGRCTS